MKARTYCGISWTFIALAVSLLAAGEARAIPVYVAPAGDDANDGLTWAAAKRTVQAALDCTTPGDQVWVAAGTYNESITLTIGVALYGGFVGHETDLSERDWVANVTILDAYRLSKCVVTCPAGANEYTRIDGFTLRNGLGRPVNGALHGAGVFCVSSSPTIANNTIPIEDLWYGDAIYCGESSCPMITGNTMTAGIYCATSSAPRIEGNTFASGGVSCKASSPVITGNTFRQGGISCNASSPMIANNAISGSGYAGISCTAGSSPTIANNTLCGHQRAGIECTDSSPLIVNNTITGNYVTIGAILCSGTSSPTIVNTLVAFNTAGIYRSSSATGTPVLRSNCVYGNSDFNYSGLADPTGTDGNISADPKLACPVYVDVHIQPDSPCMNAGEDTAVLDGGQDMDGQARVLAGRVDIGADESDGTIWPASWIAVIHVSPSGDDANDGSSWVLAKRTVQAAIDAGEPMGSQVWVAAGTYVENITLGMGVPVYGGFAGDEGALSERNWTVNKTILDGNRVRSVVYAPTGTPRTTRIDGFVIRNGTETHMESGWVYGGGGILCYSASPTIANNVITGNDAFTGGGIYCHGSLAPLIVNNWIIGNTRGGVGCGNGCAPVIANNTIAANNGIGITADSTSTIIVNNIIAFNSSAVSLPTGITNYRNNYLYSNSSGAPLIPPTGNLPADPKFADLRNGDLHLQPGSPCIDAGDDTVVQADWLDIDGQARTYAGHVDIGADEFDGAPPPPRPVMVIRVSSDGDDANDGSSWEHAKRTVQAAALEAYAGGEVWVRAGTYTERITLRGLARLYGGFAGTETLRSQRNWAQNTTILDGNQSGSIVYINAAPSMGTVDGFTLRNGTGTLDRIGDTNQRMLLGGAIYCRSAGPTIANNTIIDNQADQGGGIYSANWATILNNRIIRNTARYGGGICWIGDITAAGNCLVANTATSLGGGAYSAACYPSTVIMGNAIVANSAPDGGGIYLDRSLPMLLSPVQDTMPASEVGTDSGHYPLVPKITNTIIAFNSSGYRPAGSTTSVTLSGNCVYGNTAYNYHLAMTNPTGKNGNISADPLFVRLPSPGADGTWGTDDDDYGDLRLKRGSPCIDAGNNAEVPADATDLDGDGDLTEPLPIDLAGAVRFADDPTRTDTGAGSAPIVDIGAYEVLRGDVNDDHHVDVSDLLTLAGSWAKTEGEEGFDPACDFDGDGSVDVTDLLIFAANWGK